MTTRAEQWDRRYRERKECHCAAPAPILREVLPLLPHGRALDLATGMGVNAVFLAERGWQVTGVDFSQVGLAEAERLARERAVLVAPGELDGGGRIPVASSGLLLVRADLENCRLPVSRFDVILGLRYLQRSLFPAIARALRAGGLLLYETYTADQLKYREAPQNPEHLLHAGELRQAFPSLSVLFYREYSAGEGIATLVAEKRRGSSG